MTIQDDTNKAFNQVSWLKQHDFAFFKCIDDGMWTYDTPSSIHLVPDQEVGIDWLLKILFEDLVSLSYYHFLENWVSSFFILHWKNMITSGCSTIIALEKM
jgi:hypothetical protein